MTDNSVSVLQRGAAVQISVLAPVPVLVEFSGEALVKLLAAAQAAFRERSKPEHHARGGNVTRLVKMSGRGW